MQQTSVTWKQLWAAGARLEARAVIAGTAYADISAPVIQRAAMQDSLSVGNVVSASLALAVRSAGSIPRSAAVVIETRLSDGQTASEWLPQGTFYISRRARDPVTGLLAVECYDALLKANAVWVPSAGTWPRAMGAVTAELAALLGVTLDSRTVIPTGAAYVMSEPAEGTTMREALGIVAQAAGGNWVMTPGNRLRLVRIGETGDAVDVVGAVGGIDVGAADTVTGVRSTVDGVVTLTGDDTGIVVDVSVAPLIAAELAEALIGQRWQPFRLAGAIYDPAAELGDAVRAGAGGEVASALCVERAAYGPAFRGDISAPDPGEVTDEYPYIGSAQRTLALAKAAVTEAVDALDDSLTQQEIFERLTDNGAAQGLVLYDGQLYVNASYIQSGTLTLGGLNNQNGVLRVLDASGNQIGLWNKDGVNISKGLIRLAFDDNGSAIALGAGVGIPFSATYYYQGKQYRTYIAGNNIVESDGDNDMFLTTAALALSRNEANGVSPFVQCVDNVEQKSSVLGADSLRTGSLYLRNPLSIGNGGTGATTKADARTNLEVLRTGHLDKPNLDAILYNYIGTVWNVTGSGVSSFGSTCGTLICTDVAPFGTSGTRLQQIFMNFFGNDIWIRKRTDTTWSNWTCLRQSNGAVPVTAGGTGVTQGTIDITSQCTFNISALTDKSCIWYNPYLKMVFGTVIATNGVSVNNQAAILTLPTSVTSGVNERWAGIGTTTTSNVVVHVRISGRVLYSSHSQNIAIAAPFYNIQVFVG